MKTGQLSETHLQLLAKRYGARAHGGFIELVEGDLHQLLRDVAAGQLDGRRQPTDRERYEKACGCKDCAAALAARKRAYERDELPLETRLQQEGLPSLEALSRAEDDAMSEEERSCRAAGYTLYRMPLFNDFVILLPGETMPNDSEDDHNYFGIFSSGHEQEAWEEVAEHLEHQQTQAPRAR